MNASRRTRAAVLLHHARHRHAHDRSRSTRFRRRMDASLSRGLADTRKTRSTRGSRRRNRRLRQRARNGSSAARNIPDESGERNRGARIERTNASAHNASAHNATSE